MFGEIPMETPMEISIFIPSKLTNPDGFPIKNHPFPQAITGQVDRIQKITDRVSDSKARFFHRLQQLLAASEKMISIGFHGIFHGIHNPNGELVVILG